MWWWLALAIVSEVVGTLSLKASDGFSRPLPSVAVAVGYGVAFFALSRALSIGMPVGQAYAVWAGLGVALVALCGVLLFQESLSLVQVLGLVLVTGGVVLLEAGARH
jgi:small multidrug resistance pump